LPHFSHISKAKKIGILNNFEEVEYLKDTLLEKEGSRANYVYWIFSGEILIYKKIDIEFDSCTAAQKDKLLNISKVSSLDMFYNPTDSLS